MALTKVTSGLIADNSVGLTQLDGGTDGNLITYDASGNPSHVPTGSANQALASNGAGAAPTFQNVHTLLPSGSVLEEIALIQNGSSQTVLSGTYTAGNVTAAQELTTSYADVTGSSITYTPPSGATRVIYTLSVSATYSSTAIALSSFKTFLDSDEVTAARQTLGSSYLEAVHPLTWVFVIGGSADTATGQVASWSSGKTIKLQAQENSGNPVKLHETKNFDGVGDSTQLRVPIISIRAIK